MINFILNFLFPKPIEKEEERKEQLFIAHSEYPSQNYSFNDVFYNSDVNKDRIFANRFNEQQKLNNEH